jgi:plasmid maintenance system antidote protein VapI
MTTMTETLRDAIVDSGLPMLTLAQRTGVVRQSLMRFVARKSSLRLDLADKLAEYFGLELKPVTPRRKV